MLWPPPYYLLRDRIPFILTILYLYRGKFPRWVQDTGGWCLFILTFALAGATALLWISGLNMKPLLGFNWSIASPIEWGTFILVGASMLYRRGLTIYDSYYLVFMAGLGGGWLYEAMYFIPYWVRSGFAYWNIFKVNAAKVFFVDYQVISLPILAYFLSNKKYRWRPIVYILTPLAALFYWFGPDIIKPFNQATNPSAYSWILRIPTMLVLFFVLEGTEGDKEANLGE